MPMRVETHRPGFSAVRTKKRQDKASKRFYNSYAWISARLSHLRQYPLCEDCKKRGYLVQATVVHHKVEVRVDWDKALDSDNMQSLCASCHSRLHAQGEHHAG